MKRKIIALFISLVAVSSLAIGCGANTNNTSGTNQTQEKEEITPSPEGQITGEATEPGNITEGDVQTDEDVPVAVDFRFNHSYEGAYETGSLDALDADGNVIWTYECGKYDAAQLDQIADIGRNINGYYLLDGMDVVCLEVSGENAGKVAWRNSDFKGGLGGFCYGDSGEIFLTGYLGPDLTIIAGDGTTIAEYGSFAALDINSDVEGMTELYWPFLICYDSMTGFVRIFYESNYDGVCLMATVDPATGRIVAIEEGDPGADLARNFEKWSYYELGRFMSAQFVYQAPGDIGTVYINVNGDGSGFEAYRYYYDPELDEEVNMNYTGHIEYDYLDNDPTSRPDLLEFILDETVDETFTGWTSLGGYVINKVELTDGVVTMELLQANNGDSLFSIYYDDFMPIFRRNSLVSDVDWD